jgi:FKBP-type peptidyl-prolyl cis-trans isomerase
MNRAQAFAPVILLLFVLAACSQEPKSDLKSDKAKLSYAIGQEIGQNFKTQGIDIDASALAMSVNDVVSGKKSQLTKDDLEKIQQNFQASRMEKMKADSEKGKASGEAFLEKNKAQEGWKTTASGLQYKVETEGKGASPKDTDNVVAQYSGKLVDGTEFDSSYKRGEPAEFPVNGVIPGWTEALKMMKVGAKWHLAIPSDLAYGPQGRPPAIPPNSVLLFDIELVGIKKGHK